MRKGITGGAVLLAILGASAWGVTSVVDRAYCPVRQNADLDELVLVVRQVLPSAQVVNREVLCVGDADPRLLVFVPGERRQSEITRTFKDAGWTSPAPCGDLVSPDGKSYVGVGRSFDTGDLATRGIEIYAIREGYVPLDEHRPCDQRGE